MTINIGVHKVILFQILSDIYGDSFLAPILGFKGGTAALMFYGLDRFSVDLDLDLLDPTKENEVFEKVTKIMEKYGQVKDSYKKIMTLFWTVSYESKSQNVKVEINRRSSESQYELKTYMGVPMLVMVRSDMIANKLLAMHNRIKKTSRDIYDMWFFLGKRWPINRELLEKKSGMKMEELIQKSIEKLEKVDDNRILTGLGELLTENQKSRAKVKMKPEVMALLQLRCYNP